jgi:hypothetical protein
MRAAGGNLFANSPEQLRHLPPDIYAGLVEALVRAIDTVFLVAVPVAVLAFISAWFLEEIPLRRHAHLGAPEGEAVVGPETKPVSGAHHAGD